MKWVKEEGTGRKRKSAMSSFLPPFLRSILFFQVACLFNLLGFMAQKLRGATRRIKSIPFLLLLLLSPLLRIAGGLSPPLKHEVKAERERER